MKILFVSASAVAGGGPRHLLDWITALKARPERKVLAYIAAPIRGEFAEPFRGVAEDVFALPERSFSLMRLQALRRFVRENEIEMIHSFGRGGGVYGRLLKRSGLPTFHSPQGVISPGLKQWVYDLAEKLLRGTTTRYIFGSESEANQARDHFGASNGLVIPPIVAAPDLMETRIRDGRPNYNGSSERPLTIGTIGRLVEHKQIHRLAAAVMAAGKPWKLIIFGDGPDRRRIARLAASSGGRVELRGIADRWQALAEMDVFASWSKSESFGLAVAEAMAVGIPCVLSDVPGHRDLARAETQAWLFNPEIANDFARAIESVTGDEAERLARVHKAKLCIEGLCGRDAVAKQLFSAYES